MKVHAQAKEAYKLFHDGILALANAEIQGFQVDVPYVEKKIQHLARKMERTESLFKTTDFYKEWQASTKKPVNINSGDQLAEFLYNVKGIKISKTTTSGKGSTDADAIKKMGITELSDFYEEKNRIKKATDVLEGFYREQVNGVLHPFFNLHLPRTFRSSMDSPNMQNVPIRDVELLNLCRRAIIPRPGHQIFEPDFGQLEVRISACYNHDEKLIYDILHGDMHTDMASEIFMIDDMTEKLNSSNPITKDGHKKLRQAAKNGFVFPQFYGDYYKPCTENMLCNWGKLPQGKWKYGEGIIIDEIGKPFKPYSLADHLLSKGFKEFGTTGKVDGRWVTTGFMKHVQEIENRFWNERFVTYKKWKEIQFEEYQRKGYVDLFTGFRCSGVMNKKETSNYPVQGAAFHCLLWSLIQLDAFIRKNKLDSRIIGQIHDSILMDVNPKELSIISQEILKITTVDLPKHWPWIIIPLEIDADVCDIDRPWSEKHKFKFN